MNGYAVLFAVVKLVIGLERGYSIEKLSPLLSEM